jgi:hypothetical protein
MYPRNAFGIFWCGHSIDGLVLCTGLNTGQIRNGGSSCGYQESLSETAVEYSYTNVKGTHKVWTDAIRYHDETAGWRATSTCITEESKSYKMRYHKRNITGIKGSQNQSSLGSKLVFSERGQDHNQEMLLYAILLREQMGTEVFDLQGICMMY